MGPRPATTKFAELNAEPVSPAAIPEFLPVMDTWGSKLLGTAFTIAEMSAVGFGLDKDAFTNIMRFGPHLLAPTASDLNKHNTLDTILAGFHRDLNFVTFHGKSRFPGLDIWLRDGTKFPVSVPDGCILAQAGMEMEHLTGGKVVAGWHEVLVNDRTLSIIQKAKEAGRSLWRISSTLFAHIESDAIMSPLVGTEEEKAAALKQYPATLAGEHVENELKAINLKQK
jgi:isopenicillin N synthase-like dioxygenase